MQKFEAGLVSMPAKQRVVAEMNEAEAIGVTGTPGFFVNGRFINGAKPFEEFAKVINQELQKQGVPIPAGAQGI
jgi:predicted DsbA family dithiol-disulfide isomerase